MTEYDTLSLSAEKVPNDFTHLWSIKTKQNEGTK